jgi:uncharacterized membrane protein (DUF2068 family)
VSGSRPERADEALRLIALFKFGKAALLIAAGLGALKLLDPAIVARAQSWGAALAASSDRQLVQHLLARVAGLPPGRLEILAIGAFLYAGLFATEGVGLWLARRWAQYLTLVATASFVPIEAFEVARRLSLPRIGALALNLGVVVYLGYRLRHRRG